MTEYMFMLFDDENWFDQIDEQTWIESMKLHNEFAAAVMAAGAQITEGKALLRSNTATTVRNREGAEPLVTDGPFIETKEALGGYYVIDCKDLDQALEFAKICPAGNVELRPVMDTSEDSAPPA